MASLLSTIKSLHPRYRQDFPEVFRAAAMANSALFELESAGDAMARPGHAPTDAEIQRWMNARRRVQLQVTEVQ